MNIAVIGAGITGIMAAYYLARAGHSVTVYESERYPAMKTSRANGGQISVSNSEVWTTWANVQKGIRWMFKSDAPLYISPKFSVSKISWLSKFLLNTLLDVYETNTRITIDLGLESRKLYEEIIKSEKIKFNYAKSGIMHVYKDEHYFADAQRVQSLYQNSGCEWDIVTRDQIEEIDPALHSMPSIIGGAWTPSDSVGDIHEFCIQLAQVMQKKYGVVFNFETEIQSPAQLIGYQGDYDRVVVSSGVGSKKLAKTLGDHLDIYPVKGYSITIDLDSHSKKHAPVVSILDDQKKIVCSRLGNKLRVAGTAELAGENYDITHNRIQPLLDWVHINFPEINTSGYQSWACLRPMTPDMMPIVSQSKRNPKMFYHTGHGHLGWTLSPATAKSLAELISR